MGFVKQVGQGLGLIQPDAPDAATIAAQQKAANDAQQQTNLLNNRVNQVGPDGTVTWSTGADGRPIQTTALSAGNQALYDQQQNLSKQLGTASQGSLDQVTAALAKPMDTSGLPALSGGPSASNYQTGQFSAAPVGAASAGAASAGAGREIIRDFDTSGVRKLPGDISDTSRQRVEQALMSRLEPQYQRDEQALRTRLLNSGIEVGSDAYNNEMNNFSQRLNDARMQTVIQGGGEESRQVGLQAGLNAQEFGQLADKARFTQNADVTKSQQETSTNIANAQMASAAAEANANRAQRAGEFNASQALAGAQFNADVNKQNYGIGLTAAQAGNQTRAQGLTEQTTLRQQPLAELNALRTGSQPGTPQFGSYYTNGMASPDMLNMNSEATKNANAQSGQFGNMLGKVGSFFLSPSDARLKTNLKRIGDHPAGVGRYVWDWKDGSGSSTGVIAQELQLVRPDAVHVSASGYLAVDYAAIGGF